ncbi:hypothetical protein CSB62_22180 [Vibrio splendidus]|nr:hypothetical protein [Vibrio lentus]PHN83912.1 hypothetical protein CSB62_22180 [Vibrio splendidus]MCC4781982.1 hypothetical protein [Vibrio lentus]MCC4858704.1 hypothetical protein [Vibrio lentus]OMO27932.1 hypothetical protein BH583_04535 [Vibrio lentus]PME65567.1 hypothetical protein BCV33_13920 [Vibrio lentus]
MLYITKYEDGSSSFGGMVRVKDIESITHFSEFLTISLKHPFHYSHFINENGNKVYIVGLFRTNKLRKIIEKHSSVYFHTVGNFIKLFPYLTCLKNKRKFIDLHGAQPEEFSYSGNRGLAFLFTFFEKLAFKHCDIFIHVSYKMIKHFEDKYPFFNRKDLYVPIFSSNINMEGGLDFNKLTVDARQLLNIDDSKPIFLYSGGIQAWQKSNLVVDFAKSVLESYGRIIILSMQSTFFEERLSEFSNSPYLLIRSVKPEELSTYYIAADYGIMFRDDNTLNVVSSPTKMSEYLYYGMKPVLTSTNVGDFVDFGIEYMQLTSKLDFSTLKSEKSLVNHKIITERMSSSDKELLMEYING